MRYELRISSYSGIVAGAKHYRGRIQGEYPRSCHGATHYSGGPATCDQGHEIPKRIEWDVEATWSEDRHERWAAKRFEGAGPQQYTEEHELVRDAIAQFTGLVPVRRYGEPITPGQPGDELYLGYAPPPGCESEAEDDGWGHCIARVPK